MVIRQALVNEQQELTDQLNVLIKSGYIAEYTDTWHEWKTEINNVQQSILECDSALNELRQSIREVRLEDFNNSLDELDFTSDMASSIRELMSEEGIYDDSVKLTSSGIAQLGLMGTELVSAKQKVANYNTAIEALNKDLKNGDITQAQYNEQLREYQKDQMDAISATKDAKDAILDLIKNGIEKQTEAMEELISKRKDALSLQKEYYDFEKEMSDKSSEMRKIQAQIQALSGDDSISATQRRRSLQSQLKELQEEYEESRKDREYDIIQDAYDETLESFKENQDATILELETSLNAQNNAIANALAVAKENYTTVYEELGTLASDYNFTLTDAITTPWKDAISAIEQYEDAVGKLSGNIDIDTTPITVTNPSKTEATPTTNEASKQNVNKSANGTWIKQSGKWWYEHDDGSYTKNGFETIDGKQYYFDSSGWMKTGWVKSGKDSTGAAAWYYMNSDGSMAKNKWIGNYYVGSNGVMLRNTTTPDGYQVDKNGLWTGAKKSGGSSAKVSSTKKTLQYGMTDSEVGVLQQALKSLGYYNGNIDNIFGDQTLSALKRFQTDAKNRGEYTGQIDGVCGPLTRSAFKVKGYASGTLNATKGLHWVDENGPELIVAEDGSLITPYGRLIEMHGHEIVMNADQTKRFVDMISGAHTYPQVEKPQMPTTKIESRGGDVNVHYDNLVSVNGDITKEVFPGMEKVVRESVKQMTKELHKYKIR